MCRAKRGTNIKLKKGKHPYSLRRRVRDATSGQPHYRGGAVLEDAYRRQYSLRRRISLGTCDRGKDSREKSAGAGAAAGVAAAAEATAAAAPAPGTGLPQVSPQAELTERAACPERMQ